jgi:ADP-L-glycero-D-manno-heptose 6-epimerase
MYTIVTGAAGFIGANLVKALNERGVSDIIAVDNLTKADKFRNLVDCEIADYLDKNEFIDLVEHGELDGGVEAVLHQGACSDTMEHRRPLHDGQQLPLLAGAARFLPRPGDALPLRLLGLGLWRRPRLPRVARVRSAAQRLRLFEVPVRPGRAPPSRGADFPAQVAGFRYFNVYGPREQHKGRMASVAFHFFNQYQAEGKVKLFEGCDGYGNGEQRRDFVFIDDVVKVNLHFLDRTHLRHLQPRHRPRAVLQRRRRRHRECLPRRAGRSGAEPGGQLVAAAIEYIAVSRGAEGQVPELHRGRHFALLRQAGYEGRLPPSRGRRAVREQLAR